MINLGHPLVRLADEIDWRRFDQVFGVTYSEDSGRPAIATRLMVALHYLKYLHDLSDEQVVSAWVENPYWQYLSGMKFFEHRLPIDPSSMTRWRARIGEAGAEELLAETLAAPSGLKLKAVKPRQLKRVNVDTTVQEKHIRFPTDARLYDRMRERLVKQARADGIELRQTYVRTGKQLLYQQSRYAHAKQFKRARKCTRKLRTFLGRVMRDVERKAITPSHELTHLLELGTRLYRQQRHDKNKLYSVHAPEVECISKGKAHKRYEFGNKVAVAATSKGGWLLAAKACHGNPYDGHTLKETMEQVDRVIGRIPEHVYVDMVYRGHDYEGEAEIHVDKRKRGRIAKSVWRWMKRRAGVEPSIAHLKDHKRMDRNRLKGKVGDAINALLSAAGMNLSKIIKALRALLSLLALLHTWLRPTRPADSTTRSSWRIAA